MVQLTPTRYKLQTRILAPIVVFAVLVSGLIGFAFHSNYTTFQDRMNKQTEERANSLRKTFLHVIHEIEEYVAIINKNKLIQDNLLEDDKSEVLNALQLFIEHGFISLISIHGMDGTALAKTYAPGEFEKTDGISDFAREIANDPNTAPLITVRKVKKVPTILVGRRLDVLNGPAGVTVIGVHLGDAFFKELKDGTEADLALYFEGSLIGSSLGPAKTGVSERFQATPVDLGDWGGEKRPITLMALEDNSLEAALFKRNLIIVIAGLVVIGLGVFFVSYRVLQRVLQRIQNLSLQVNLVARGDLTPCADIQTADEIGNLSLNIDAMRATIHSRTQELEKTVEILSGEVAMRKETETTLRKLSRAVEQSPYMVFITDTEGIIEYVNPRFTEMSGYKASEVLGKNPRILKSPDTPSQVHVDLWRTLKEGKVWRHEIKDRRKDGTAYWASATIAPVRDSQGEISHFVAMHVDITQRKEAEKEMIIAKDQAEIANRAKSEILANMSHELRTPLNAIIGFSSTMNEELFGPLGNEKYKEYAGDIFLSGNHLLDLINDILDVSAIEAGKLELHEDDLDVNEVAEASLRLVKPRAEEGGVRLLSDVQESLPQIHADERRIKQILLNLLSNAIKFTPKGGRVTLGAAINGSGALHLTVADTGIGMDQEGLAKALKQFGQIDGSLARKHEGTGLGLPLTKGLVEAHGGVFNLQSEPGKGTVVSIVFPVNRLSGQSTEPR